MVVVLVFLFSTNREEGRSEKLNKGSSLIPSVPFELVLLVVWVREGIVTFLRLCCIVVAFGVEALKDDSSSSSIIMAVELIFENRSGFDGSHQIWTECITEERK